MHQFVRRCSCALALSALPFVLFASSLPPSFGAFGYPGPCRLAFFIWDEYKLQLPGGRVIQYCPEDCAWSVQRLSYFDKVVIYRPVPGYPMRVRADAGSSSVSLEYRDGFILKGTGDAPFLTWSDASAGAGVPSPRVPWVALSWRSGGPVVLLRFAQSDASVVVEEKDGGWSLRSTERYSGWVHLWMPLGLEEVVTTSAAEFGRLAARVRPVAESLVDVPRIVGWSVDYDSRGITSEWRFDLDGALVPSPVLAEENRLRLKLLSAWMHLGTTSSVRSKAASLRIRFIARRLETGRAVTSGLRVYDDFNLDEPKGVCEATLAYLWNRLSPQDERVLRTSVRNWLAEVSSVREPFTQMPLPGGRRRETIDEFAAFAFAELVLLGRSDGLTALAAALDWTSWTLGLNEKSIFATNVLALAGAISDDPYLRAVGALAAAGARSSGIDAGFEALRDAVYPIASALELPLPPTISPGLSAIRLHGGEGVEARQQTDGSIVLESLILTPQPFTITLTGLGKCEVVGKFNLEAPVLVPSGRDLTIMLRPRRVGYLKLVLKPSVAVSCPTSVPSPRCNEDRRSPFGRLRAPQ